MANGVRLCQLSAAQWKPLNIMTNYLTGSYQHNIDSKGRLTIPVKLREQLGDTFYLTKGIDGCIFVYPEKEWDVFMEDLCSKPISRAAAVQRHFIANSALVETDSMGRILIPKNLREYAKLEKDTMFLGVGKRAEIWSTEEFERFTEAQTQESIMAVMSSGLI